jgi:hypothetical protein
MIKFEYINKHLDRIRYEVKVGFLPVGIIKHFEVYSRYDQYLKQGYDKSIAILFAGEDLKVSERQIYRIIHIMEEEL